MEVIKFLFPFSYFYKSRLNSFRSFFFHFYYEWLLNILILIFVAKQTVIDATTHFILAYLAFISIYELGYLANDVFSIRKEINPRKRIRSFDPSSLELIIWIFFRLLVFAGITYFLGAYAAINWWSFYFLLALYFLLHNILASGLLKTFTFFNLAIFRFFAPIFIFLEKDQFLILVPSVIINYVLYRTLTYMDSKELIKVQEREDASFKFYYYLLFLGLSLFFSIIIVSPIPIVINLYYMIFMFAFYLKSVIT